jgi:3-oxoacyl-[acyl-carrier-protein] synthase-3
VYTSRILAVGQAFPERELTNQDLEKMVETNSDWIVERTGIKSRRIVEAGQGASTIGAEAALAVLKKAGRKPEEIDTILVATVTPDMQFPSTSCIIQNTIGATNAWAMDINAACSGFIYALSTADQFIKTGKSKKLLLIGVDIMSSIVDYEDRTTCVLFGDGAGAVYIEGDKNCPKDRGIIDTMLFADGSGQEFLSKPAGGSALPASHETVDKKQHFIRQDGKQVFKAAVNSMKTVTENMTKKHNLTGKDIDFFVAHQANLRIIDACAKRLDIDKEKVVINIDRYGNTTAATIPTCLAEIHQQGRLKDGDVVLMAAFGAGYTWGSALVRWG